MTAPIPVTAGQLVPGDVVVDADTGEREFAAFDVDVTAEDRIRVWTAEIDQTFGWPRDFTLVPSTPLTVARRAAR